MSRFAGKVASVRGAAQSIGRTKKTTVVRTVCRKVHDLCGDKPEPCDHNRW
jgi:hypothetical protein